MKKVIAAALCLFVCLTASAKSPPQRGQDAEKPGRFHVVQISEYRRDQLLIDSATGRLWRNVCLSKEDAEHVCPLSYWKAEAIENITISSDALQKAIGEAKSN